MTFIQPHPSIKIEIQLQCSMIIVGCKNVSALLFHVCVHGALSIDFSLLLSNTVWWTLLHY